MNIEPKAATGLLTLTDDKTIRFSLDPAVGHDGLYQAETIDPDGRYTATTAIGATASGVIQAHGRAPTRLMNAGHDTVLYVHATRFDRSDLPGVLRMLTLGDRLAGESTTGPGFIDPGADF